GLSPSATIFALAEPSALIVQMLESHVNASRVPSGNQAGVWSRGPRVSRRGPEPLAFMTHKPPPL
ncbi:MAG TPA: hypothetical protein VGV57_13985, partial [Thermoleophilaceae bacterium]|nr:hypothetical protein [Thermoleophilaceae bacterium]